MDFPRLARGEGMMSWSARMERAFAPLLNLSGDNRTARIERVGNSLVVSALPSAAVKPFSLLAVDSSGHVVRVRGGCIRLGSVEVEVADTDVVVAGGTVLAPTWGAVEFNPTTQLGRILEATTVDKPAHSLGDSVIARRPLFRAYLQNGRPVVMDWRWDGDWDLTGWFA